MINQHKKGKISKKFQEQNFLVFCLYFPNYDYCGLSTSVDQICQIREFFLCQYTHCNELLVHVSSLPFICLEVNVSTIFFSNATSKVEQRHHLSVKGVRFSDLKRQYIRETHCVVRIFHHGKATVMSELRVMFESQRPMIAKHLV